MTQPKLNDDDTSISFENQVYHVVGCRKCGFQKWMVCFDGKKSYVIHCVHCGHTKKLESKNVVPKPDNYQDVTQGLPQ